MASGVTPMQSVGWIRDSDARGPKCGQRWRHVSGWRIEHCGHPTAIWPWAIYSPAGELYVHPCGYAFKRLDEAMAAVRMFVGGDTGAIRRRSDGPEIQPHERKVER